MTDLTAPFRKQIDELEARKAAKFIEVTPEIGEIVLWFDGGVVAEENKTAAIVTRIERPGVITVELCRPHGMKKHVQNVRWFSTVSDVDRNNQTTRECGLFTLRDSQQIQARHKKPYLDDIDKQIEILEIKIAQVLKEQADREAQLAQLTQTEVSTE